MPAPKVLVSRYNLVMFDFLKFSEFILQEYLYAKQPLGLWGDAPTPNRRGQVSSGMSVTHYYLMVPGSQATAIVRHDVELTTPQGCDIISCAPGWQAHLLARMAP